MGHVRTFGREDIPQVAELHATVFGTGIDPTVASPDAYHRYFSDVFLDHPWRDERLPSRVYEESDGRISGFIGVVPRRLSMDGRPLVAAVCSQFIVHPEKRGMVGLQLLKAVLDGPQDLTYSDEANDSTRRIWNARGGATALLYSLRWVRPLRPAHLIASWLQHRWPVMLPGPVWRVLASAADAVVGPQVRRSVGRSGRALKHDRLDSATVVANLPAFAGRSLRPEYDEGSLDWLLRRAEMLRGHACFEQLAVRDKKDELLGWYLWRCEGSGFGDVLQIVANRKTIAPVLDHLVERAWRRGAFVLSGRLDPAFADDLAAAGYLSHTNAPWMLVHSRHASVLQAILRGDTLLSRLDGEWCLRFQS